MAAVVEKEKQLLSYLPYRTLKNFIRSLVQGVPPRIDKSMMRSMSGSTQAQLWQSLRGLGLMDDQGVPSESLKRLVASVSDEKAFKDALLPVMQTGYPFLKHFNLQSATLKMLQEEFEKMGASGGTVEKCISFFTAAAKDAGLVLSPYIEGSAKRMPTNGRQRKPRQAARAEPPFVAPLTNQQGNGSAQVRSWHEMLLEKFPAFDPGWSAEVQAKWFESFAKLHASGEDK